MKRDERIYLNDLSKKVYGTSSKWQKLINKGEVAKQKETLEDGTEREYLGISKWNLEDLKKTMEEIWAEEQERMAKEKTEESQAEVKNE